MFVEAQPVGRATMAWRIVDAASGVLERGEVNVKALEEVQPWSESEP